MNLKFYKVVLTFLLLVTSKNIVQAQENITQKYIDTLTIEPIDSLNVSIFKNHLLKNTSLKGWTKYYSHKGFLCLKQGQKDSALFYSKKAIKTFNELESNYTYAERTLQRAHYIAGVVYFYDKKDFYNALEHFHKSFDIHKKYPEHYPIQEYILGKIAAIHLTMGNNQLSLKYQKQIEKKYYYKLKKSYKATNLAQIAVLYDYLGKIDSAKIYYQKVLNLKYPRVTLAGHNNLGALYYNQKQYDSAIYHFTIAKKIADTIDLPRWAEDSRTFAKTNNHFVNIYQRKVSDFIIKDLNIKIDSLKNLENIGREDRDMMLTTMDYLALAYEEKNQLQLANNTYKRKVEFLSYFNDLTLDEELQKLELRFETKNKEAKINNLEKVKVLQEKRIQQQNIIIYILIGIALLVVLLIAMWFNRKNLKNKYEKVVLQQQLLRSQMNPHFLFNTLNTILHTTDTEPQKTKQYILKLSRLLRTTLENSREEFVPLEDEIEAIDNYLNLQSNFSEKFNFKVSIASDLETKFTYVPPMLIQPFVENAIIHGIMNTKTRGLISLNFTKDGDELITCTIIDNGIGYSKSIIEGKENAKEHNSISGDIVKERLAIYNKQTKSDATLKIEDIFDDQKNCIGTKVILNLPSYEI